MSAARELPHFTIGKKYGGYQNWFHDPTMKLGGCGAVTACDLSLYLAREKGLTELYPFDANELSKKDYIAFSRVMKPYLRPRVGGIDTLELYMDGFQQFLNDRGAEHLWLEGVHGEESADTAAQAVIEQIDSGIPVPCLTLHHADRTYRDYEWHWFLLNGYQLFDGELVVRAVTYGDYRWLDFRGLWNTGTEPKGGIIRLLGA